MLASFYSSGSKPLSRDQLNRVHSDGSNFIGRFSSLGNMPSGPVALLTSSVRRQTKTSSGERLVGSRKVVGEKVDELAWLSLLFKTLW